MKKAFLTLGLFVGFISIFAQVITTNPSFPTDSEEIVITFNADQGNGGLEDFTEDIWAHTGVITNLSTGPTNWKYVKTDWGENTDATKLVKISENVYQLTITSSAREYYEVPEGEEIEQLAFVFRNSDGSVTGRDSDGADIYANIFEPGLNLKLQKPEADLIVQLGDVIEINAVSAFSTSLNIYIDNELFASTTELSISESLTVQTEGIHWIKVAAINDTATIADSVYFFVRNEVPVEEMPTGMIDGVNYINDTTVTLVLYAPEKEFVFAIGDFSNWELYPTITLTSNGQVSSTTTMMKKTPDNNHYWITLTSLEVGKEYIYQYFIDGEIKVADPYTDKTSDPWMDHYISDEIYPDLIDYPAGKTTEIASVFQTAQEEYEWEISDFVPPAVDNMIIYEMLIRDFTSNGDYKTVMDTLDYLENLGINVLELMPFNEFEGNDSWGYNPSFYFAPDKAYGTKNDLKTLIDECHKRGIAVIMDMVLNHSYGQSPLARMYFDGGNPTENNPWYNVTSPNDAYSWGYDFNHESQATKDFVDRVNKYWIEEYKVDGYRFDFTKGFTNTPGDGGAFDQSRIDILKRMADKVWEYDNDAVLILEHFAENSEEIILSDHGFLIWGNMNGSYNKATMGWVDLGNSNLAWASYKSRNWSKPNLVTYMESHDEERLMYKNLNNANFSDTYNIKNLWIALQRIEQAANFFITIPGPKMIWQFGELGYDISINYNGRVGRKPIKWDYYDENDRQRLYQVYSAINKLKTSEEAFKSDDFTMETGYGMKKIHINHESMDVVILGNFGVEEGQIDPEFPYPGNWYEFYSGETLEVTDINAELTFNPGEYRLYTSEQLEQPDIIANVEMAITDTYGFEINLYPNPVSTEAFISVNSKLKTKAEIALYDYTGQKISTIHNGYIPNGISDFSFNIEGFNLTKGIYFIHFNSKENQIIKKLVIR
jgi:glycosidase